MYRQRYMYASSASTSGCTASEKKKKKKIRSKCDRCGRRAYKLTHHINDTTTTTTTIYMGHKKIPV